MGLFRWMLVTLIRRRCVHNPLPRIALDLTYRMSLNLNDRKTNLWMSQKNVDVADAPQIVQREPQVHVIIINFREPLTGSVLPIPVWGLLGYIPMNYRHRRNLTCLNLIFEYP